MQIALEDDELINAGLPKEEIKPFLSQLNTLIKDAHTNEEAWHFISKNLLTTISNFNIHLLLYKTIYPNWQEEPDTAPAIIPTLEDFQSANIRTFSLKFDLHSVKELLQFSITHIETFWDNIARTLNIIFKKPPEKILKSNSSYEHSEWFYGAKLNIIDSCFKADPKKTALIYQAADMQIHQMSYEALNELSNQVANGLIKLGLHLGDPIAIAMPMNQYAVAIYLGIIKMGGVVVSIADSFSSDEIQIRLAITNCKLIFTQDTVGWLTKAIPLYEKVKMACEKLITRIPIIVTSRIVNETMTLNTPDHHWQTFLADDTHFETQEVSPMSACNILFSSGTTGTPKAIVWNHTTAIKAASDGYFHQNIKSDDIIAWPTNLGWMMGPWLIFAALINDATIALAFGAPKDRAFGEFIQNANVTILGVVPTLVATWRESKCMEGLNLNKIKLFSSTGECSTPEDMLYLMSLAGYKPIIEYCGGTEIGGAYITSTIIENNYPSLFTTPAMGIHLRILNQEEGLNHIGEVAIQPPSIGLSETLLNADHHQIYFENMPTVNGITLRRHGDQIKETSKGFFSLLGRVDDTMKLGGIKISAAEIERCVTGIENIIEVAAIAVPPVDGGPNHLIIFISTLANLSKDETKKAMQQKINHELNPLFKIHDIVFMRDLPKTASNKIMRRVLRNQYQNKEFER